MQRSGARGQIPRSLNCACGRPARLGEALPAFAVAYILRSRVTAKDESAEYARRSEKFKSQPLDSTEPALSEVEWAHHKSKDRVFGWVRNISVRAAKVN